MTGTPSIDWDLVRSDFPVLKQSVHGKPLIYLDSANTGQKPRAVIRALDAYFSEYTANVSRAVHAMGALATERYEQARNDLAGFIGARPDELILTSGTTLSINLVAYSWALPKLKAGDCILLTRMEHHANIVPWQLIAERCGAKIKVVNILDNGELDMESLRKQMTADVRILGVTHVSNVLGTVNPIRDICREAARLGITTVVDGSQAVPHRAVDVHALGCDFYAFTGHKMCGPTGTGALWAKREHIAAMPPFLGGGEMIKEVSFDGTVFNQGPHKFEAGTPNIAGHIGWGAAVHYLNRLQMAQIDAREQHLLRYATERMLEVPGLRIIGNAKHKASVISFLLEGAHAHDLATLLDLEGVAVRSGHHCAHPLMQFYKVPATCRASLAFYNNESDVDTFISALNKVRKLLA